MPNLVTAALPSSPTPAPPPPPAAAPTEAHTSFHSILSELNPLQYLPIIGTIYRAMTGDTIPDAARSVGSFVVSGLIGGPIGLVTNAAMQAIERITGFDPEKIGHEFLVSLGVGHREAEPMVAAAATPSDLGASPPEFTGWSPAQLMAYGVTTAADGMMKRDAIKGADVLNGLELARHENYPAASFIA
jgi:hypothetical protein